MKLPTGTNHSPPRGTHAPPSKKQDLNTTPPRHLKPPPSVLTTTTTNTQPADIPALDSPLVKTLLPVLRAPSSVDTTAASTTTPQPALKTGRFSGTPPLTPTSGRPGHCQQGSFRFLPLALLWGGQRGQVPSFTTIHRLEVQSQTDCYLIQKVHSLLQP